MMRAKDEVNVKQSFRSIETESDHQLDKWGVQDRTLMEWLCYLMEEVGELAEAIAEAEYRGRSTTLIRDEAVQVATLAAKISIMAYTGEPENG